ncbi:type I polyketide synthase [Gloeobacter kilaueensis]|uniref:Beta-ketoacyl synthase n=1 Tax=Gloeobacter kilaueensis (strain ATCC BAA-2537 / CCAP 1431/1 / ULC 316 / JS1) TaxID=1183438 RepID=U5QLW2_GLOK1|nr:type I polyketide synthase [Gloeobacter kilaueensis]AGY59896.1 beta-ketoacyl synthase [Gloeobacter kilaueensis JS1]
MNLPIEPVAIIGVAALFPKAKDAASFWQNILDKVDAVSEAPPSWARHYFDPDSKEQDRIYTTKGGFLGELAEFDPTEFGIMPNTIDAAEPDHFIALKLARDALADAGYLDRPFNRKKAGIILGHGVYVNRGHMAMLQQTLVLDQTIDTLRRVCPDMDDASIEAVRRALRANTPAFNAEVVPGMVPNVITGRIANRLDLMGTNYLIDAACASGLVAVELAMKELASGRCDLMLAGGVQASLPPQYNMAFCQLGALSHTSIRPFDKAADGNVMGEGCGILVLKRLKDAERDGDRIYAVVKGVGSSSNGKALGMLAPRLEGEVLALEEAYAQTGIDPASVDLVEAHGTGIPVGDRTEMEALAQVYGARSGELPRVGMGSVKSMIGHCIPASGAASFIKIALALYHKVLPPTLLDAVNPDLGVERTPFYLNNQTRPWVSANQRPRRAGINAFGFGGINAHALLEEYRPSGPEQILHRHWPSELFVFAAADRAGLISQIEAALALADRTSLAQLACNLAAAAGEGRCRLALIARNGEELTNKLNQAIEKLKDSGRVRFRGGLFYNEVAPDAAGAKTAMIFPGEGCQYPNMLADLCLYFPVVREWFDFLDSALGEGRPHPPSRYIFPPPTAIDDAVIERTHRTLYQMELAVASVATASMALYELLREFEVRPDVMVGHSTGELTSLVASGVVRLADRSEMMSKLLLMNTLYQQLEETNLIPRGVLLTVGALRSEVLAKLLDEFPDRLHLAMDNCPNQVVLFGDEGAIAEAADRLQTSGAICQRLPFDRAYHTPLFEAPAQVLRAFYDALDVGPAQTPLYSCATVDRFPDEPEAIRELGVRQWPSRVRFRETISQLHDEGVRFFIEVGPSGNLTGFVDDILKGRDYRAVPVNSQRKSGLEQLQFLIGQLFVAGQPVSFDPFFKRRGLVPEAPEAAPTKKRRGRILDLTLPHMELPENFALPSLNGKVTAPSAPAPAPPVPAPPPPAANNGHAALSAIPVAPDPQPVVIGDAGAAIVHDHFTLMQEFLASQDRLFASLVSAAPAQAGSTHAPVQADPWPYLGEILACSDGMLHCRRRYAPETDTFLEDHTLGGNPSALQPELLPLPILPFTTSMEMIAQAALYLAGGSGVVSGMSDVRGYRWLALDRGALTLEVVARLLPGGSGEPLRVQAQLFQLSEDDPEQRILGFEATVLIAENYAPAPAPRDLDPGTLWQMSEELADDRLYLTGMFHGPRFQSLRHIRCCGEKGIEADLYVYGNSDYFADGRQGVFQIDQSIIDAAGQLSAFWLSQDIDSPEFSMFPFQVGRFEQFGPPAPAGTILLCRCRSRYLSESVTESDLDYFTPDGQLVYRLTGWLNRFFLSPPHYQDFRIAPQHNYLSEPWLQEQTGLICRRYANPGNYLEESWEIWKRVTAHLILGEGERAFWYGLPEQGTRRRDWLLGRLAAKEALRQWAGTYLGVALAPADFEIWGNELGRPEVHCPALAQLGWMPAVSIAHSDGCAVAAVAADGYTLGIDLQRRLPLRTADWVNVAFESTELALLPDATDELALLGLWCAKEAAAKAHGTGLAGAPRQWQVVARSPDGSALTVHHAGLFFGVQLWASSEEVFAVCRAVPTA